jgi:cell division protein FtsB
MIKNVCAEAAKRIITVGRMSFPRRTLGLYAGAALALGMVLLLTRGPQGLGSLRELRQQIQVKQEQNSKMRREIIELEERARRLETDKDEQEALIREQIPVQKQNEIRFKPAEPPKSDHKPLLAVPPKP